MSFLVFIGSVALCLVVSSALLQRFEEAAKADGSLSFLVIGDWGRKGAYNQSEVAFQVITFSRQTMLIITKIILIFLCKVFSLLGIVLTIFSLIIT